MDRKISVIGGDLRISKLASMLAEDGNQVSVYGMEKSNEIEENDKITKCANLEETINRSDIIIGSVPFLKGEDEMYATFSNKPIKVEELLKNRHKDKIFIAGSIPLASKIFLEKKFGKVIDVMEREELVILNTIATAEGTIEVAISNTDKILHGSKVLVLGFGRVGKVVARKFYELSARVSCAARKTSDLAWIKAFGYEAININFLKEDSINNKKTLADFDIIINTVPQMIVTKNTMKYMKKDVLLIDLASNPGGINKDDAKDLGLKLVWALALPGKVAPVTSAEFIKLTIYNILDECKNL